MKIAYFFPFQRIRSRETIALTSAFNQPLLISRNVTTPAASRMRFSISRLRNRVNSLLKLDNTHSCVRKVIHLGQSITHTRKQMP